MSMMSIPRAKPWEQKTSALSSITPRKPSLAEDHEESTPPGATTTRPPAIARPATLDSGPYGNSRYGGYGGGGGIYGGGGYGGGYASGAFGGGFGPSMYGNGGYGLYGNGGYGLYGNSYGLSMYSGMNGMGASNGPIDLGEGTQATFRLIESIIGAVGGFAQMLEATYMATHSSFYTMVSLAEQFGNMRNAVGSLLGIFTLIKFVKRTLHKLAGSRLGRNISYSEFDKFQHKRSLQDISKNARKTSISLKPLIIFLGASIGLPYLLGKAIQILNAQNQARLTEQPQGPPGSFDPSKIDLNQLEFAKALYEFNPENPKVECALKAGELVAILTKTDPQGADSLWWKVRSRLGSIGYVPSNYLAIISRKSHSMA